MKRRIIKCSSYQVGFTFIELMIVTAIIGILVAFSFRQYQNYVIRAQVARAIGEVGSMKIAVVYCLNNGINEFDESTLCQNPATESNILIPSIPEWNSDDGTIIATLGNHANTRIKGDTITLTRRLDGTWICEYSGDVRFASTNCSRY